MRDKSVLREVNDQYVEITTPYLDRHNDYTQIYVRRDNGAFLLTDGGETIQDLRASGCDLETSKRKDLLTSTLNGFGIRRDGDALLVKATPQDFLFESTISSRRFWRSTICSICRFLSSPAFLNDENRAPSTTIVDALRNYDIVPVIWSGRDSVRQELAA